MNHLIRRILTFGMALCLCLSICLIPANAAVDKSQMLAEGEYGLITQTLSLTKSDDNYVAAYTAETTMVDWLAQAAAVCKDDPRMANLRFTCTLKDALTEKIGTITISDYAFISAKYNGTDIFVPDEPNAVTVSDGSIKLRYKLNPAVLAAWKTAGTAEVKSVLQQPMNMATSKSISVSAFEGIGSTINTAAQIDITMTEGSIPFYNKAFIVAAKGLLITDNPVHTDGGGGTAEPTVVVKDKTPDTDTGTDVPTAGGTTTVDKPNAKPNEKVKIVTEPNPSSMVDHITVTDEEAKRIPLTYDGEGIYEFNMPEKGTATVEATYRLIPANPDETGVSRLLDINSHNYYLIGDTKGNFRPNASITRAEVATAFFRLLKDQNVARTLHFDDVSDKAWYSEPVEVLASLGILKGVGNDEYQPNRAITRAEFATIAARFTDKNFSGVSFSDVEEDAWYADAVSTAAHFGWIVGVGDGRFAPDRPITRTEAAAIINRMTLRICDWIKVDAGYGRHYPDVSDTFWGRYEISEASNDHDYSREEHYHYESWHMLERLKTANMNQKK